MQLLYVGIQPNPLCTRILALGAQGHPMLKARLCASPAHRHALPLLLRTLCLWQKAPVRAVLFADPAATLSEHRYCPGAVIAAASRRGGLLHGLPIQLVHRPPRLCGHLTRDPQAPSAFAELREQLQVEVLVS
jgi:hypothetical protein